MILLSRFSIADFIKASYSLSSTSLRWVYMYTVSQSKQVFEKSFFKMWFGSLMPGWMTSWAHKVVKHSHWLNMSQAELTRSGNTAVWLAEWWVKLNSQGCETQPLTEWWVKMSSQGHETLQFCETQPGDWLNKESQAELTRLWNTAVWLTEWWVKLSSQGHETARWLAEQWPLMSQAELTWSWNTARWLAEWWVKLSSQAHETQQFHWLNDKSSWAHKLMKHSKAIGWIKSQAELLGSWNTAVWF